VIGSLVGLAWALGAHDCDCPADCAFACLLALLLQSLVGRFRVLPARGSLDQKGNQTMGALGFEVNAGALSHNRQLARFSQVAG